jgi:hypothetical protein
VTAELAAGEEHGVVLFGWENCPCTWYATNRFDAEDLCYRRLTWADRNSDLMLYLQCVEGNNNDHSFIYTKDGGEYKFQGNGFAFMTSAMTPSTLNTMLNKLAPVANARLVLSLAQRIVSSTTSAHHLPNLRFRLRTVTVFRSLTPTVITALRRSSAGTPGRTSFSPGKAVGLWTTPGSWEWSRQACAALGSPRATSTVTEWKKSTS